MILTKQGKNRKGAFIGILDGKIGNEDYIDYSWEEEQKNIENFLEEIRK